MNTRSHSGDSDEFTADFGFRRVPVGEKPALVGAVFDSVAARYDLMNDLMSGGLHRLWKRALLDQLSPRPGIRLIDLAGGTGDIAFRVMERLRARAKGQAAPSRITAKSEASPSRILVVDANRSMLEVGRDRAIDRGILSGIDWVAGRAEEMPIATGAANACTVAFGIRNVTDIAAALAEARRVLAPGGRFLCLEFSHMVIPLLDRLYRRYSFSVLPALGGIVAGDRDSYRYLAESIRRFPDQESFAAMIAAAGFERVAYRNLSGGIVALHGAWRI